MSDISKLSFEAALAELEKIIGQLEAGDVALEESIGLYERGALLKRHCTEKLKSAREKIDKVVIEADGKPSVGQAVFD